MLMVCTGKQAELGNHSRPNQTKRVCKLSRVTFKFICDSSTQPPQVEAPSTLDFTTKSIIPFLNCWGRYRNTEESHVPLSTVNHHNTRSLAILTHSTIVSYLMEGQLSSDMGTKWEHLLDHSIEAPAQFVTTQKNRRRTVIDHSLE